MARTRSSRVHRHFGVRTGSESTDAPGVIWPFPSETIPFFVAL
jgi:hypothetical protein